MIVIAVIGVIVNFLAAYYTREGNSLNQHAVNLHMLEDVLGWVVVLIGAIVIKFTNIYYIDSVMSIGISIYLIIEALKNLKEIIGLVLEKVPSNIKVSDIKNKVLEISDVEDIHHVHVWSLDGDKILATMHVVSDKNVKEKIREKLKELDIYNVTIEMETTKEVCEHKECS